MSENVMPKETRALIGLRLSDTKVFFIRGEGRIEICAECGEKVYVYDSPLDLTLCLQCAIKDGCIDCVKMRQETIDRLKRFGFTEAQVERGAGNILALIYQQKIRSKGQ